MTSAATTPEQYLQELPADRKAAMENLRNTILENLPPGFQEVIGYGMLGYVVPHSIYPPGYHCNKKLPLPFINLASQKNHISLHHMGLYAMPAVMKWFTEAYAKTKMGTPDIGKGCLRFKKPDQIPYALIGELCSKISVQEWVTCYEKNFKQKAETRAA